MKQYLLHSDIPLFDMYPVANDAKAAMGSMYESHS